MQGLSAYVISVDKLHAKEARTEITTREVRHLKFRQLFLHFRVMKHYFIAAAAVFITGLLLGYFYSDRFEIMIQEQLKGLEGLASTVSKTDKPQLWLFVIIFLNNWVKSVFSIYIGFAFGVFPLFFLLLNGMILGYIGEMQAAQHQWIKLLQGILPHGILEIPAIIIASAYGIRLGMLVLKGLFLLISPGKKTAYRVEFRGFMQMSMQLVLFLTIVLFAAAIIESTFTFWLISR
ncbi:MAG: putative rane protein [Paenibacillaceae bacterium]|jgi:stage II sporulation protein M|nr:putative rane protein [Paenibacillaceae bacterium]